MISKNKLKPKVRITKKDTPNLAEYTMKKYLFFRLPYFGYMELVFREGKKTGMPVQEQVRLNQTISNIQLQLNLLNNREPLISITKETVIIYLERLLKNIFYIAINNSRSLFDSLEKVNLNETSRRMLVNQLSNYRYELEPLLLTMLEAATQQNRYNHYSGLVKGIQPDKPEIKQNLGSKHHGDYFRKEIKFLQKPAMNQTSGLPVRDAVFKQVLLLLRHIGPNTPGMSENKSKMEMEISKLIESFSIQSSKLKFGGNTKANSSLAEERSANKHVLKSSLQSSYRAIKNLVGYAYLNSNISRQAYEMLHFLLVAAYGGSNAVNAINAVNSVNTVNTAVAIMKDGTVNSYFSSLLSNLKFNVVQHNFFNALTRSGRLVDKRVINDFEWSNYTLSRSLNNALKAYSINRLDSVYNAVVSILQHWMTAEKGLEMYFDKSRFYKDFVNYLESGIDNEFLQRGEETANVAELKEYEMERIVDKLVDKSFSGIELKPYHHLTNIKLKEYLRFGTPEGRERLREYMDRKQERVGRNTFKYLFLSDRSYSDFINRYMNMVMDENAFKGEAGIGWIEFLKNIVSVKVLKTDREINRSMLDHIYKNNVIRKNFKQAGEDRRIFKSGTVVMELKREKGTEGHGDKAAMPNVIQKTEQTVINVEKPAKIFGAQAGNIDMDRLADRVYLEIEKKIRNERQLLGL